MLLKKLAEYSERLELRPSLYSEGPVRYWVNLDRDGRYLPPFSDSADPSSPRTRRGQRRLLPQVQRAFGIRPLLLADKADYTLGYAADEKRAKRAADCHQAYLALVERCAAETAEPDVRAVLNFLHNDPVDQIQPDDSFDPSGIITFRVEGQNRHRQPRSTSVLGVGQRRRRRPDHAVPGVRKPPSGAGPAPSQGEGDPGRAYGGHQPYLGQFHGLRVLRSQRFPGRSHLLRLRRGIHPRTECPAGKRTKQVHLGRRRVRLLDPRGIRVQFHLGPGRPGSLRRFRPC